MPRNEEVEPAVGVLATKSYVTDSYPLIITRVSDSGKTFWCKPINTDGAKPARHNGPWPLIETFYTPEEGAARIEADAPETRVTRTKQGWRIGGARGTRVRVGVGLYRIDYSF